MSADTPQTDEAKKLHALFEADWEYHMEQSPVWASMMGDKRWHDKWGDASLSAIEARHEHARETLRELGAIGSGVSGIGSRVAGGEGDAILRQAQDDEFRFPSPESRVPRPGTEAPKPETRHPIPGLSPEDQLNYDLFEDNLKREIDRYPYGWHLMPVGPSGGPQTMDNVTRALTFDTAYDYECWVARLEALDKVIDDDIELMREGMRRGMMHPKIVLQRVPRQIERQLVTDPEESGFFAPFKDRVSGAGSRVSGADAQIGSRKSEIGNEDPKPDTRNPIPGDRLAEAAKKAILGKVVPAYMRFHRFFMDEYLPASRETIGCSELPNGDDLYGFFVRSYTTTDLSPEQVHEIGLSEVARIHAEFEAVMRKTGFSGTLPEFFQFLRTDPQFYCTSAEELLMTYRATAKRIDPLLVKVFRTCPRQPYGVEPIPDSIAPDSTMGYYQPGADDGSRAGNYCVNLYDPASRPKYEMMALSIHESVPGHHFQIALAQELTNLPKFRRHGHWTGYVEGWALYAESLGDELGLYEDPYSKFGQLTYEMWRAVRLVVDTGMHRMHWERQRAIDYFMTNAAKTELDVVNEIDRYIAWPAQALAYKIGELKMKELRKKATEALGDKFDLREFHDVVLLNGPLPLNVLDGVVDAWLRRQAA